jgi:hypothetical protein
MSGETDSTTIFRRVIDPEDGSMSPVRERAMQTSEYCLMPQAVRRLRFPLDHIIAKQHGGKTTLENLALCCGRCNRHKGPNIAGVDSITGQMVRLFNPRADRWDEHFRLNGPRIDGITQIGWATVLVLHMNHPEDIAIRIELLAQGRFHSRR